MDLSGHSQKLPALQLPDSPRKKRGSDSLVEGCCLSIPSLTSPRSLPTDDGLPGRSAISQGRSPTSQRSPRSQPISPLSPDSQTSPRSLEPMILNPFMFLDNHIPPSSVNILQDNFPQWTYSFSPTEMNGMFDAALPPILQNPELTPIFTNLIALLKTREITIVVQNYSPKDLHPKVKVTPHTYFYVMYSFEGQYIGELICEAAATISAKEAAFADSFADSFADPANRHYYTRSVEEIAEDGNEVPAIHIRWIGIDGRNCVRKGYGIILLMFGICSCFINYPGIRYSYLEDCSVLASQMDTLYNKLGYMYDNADLQEDDNADLQEGSPHSQFSSWLPLATSPNKESNKKRRSNTISSHDFPESPLSDDSSVTSGDLCESLDGSGSPGSDFTAESCKLNASDISVGTRVYILWCISRQLDSLLRKYQAEAEAEAEAKAEAKAEAEKIKPRKGKLSRTGKLSRRGGTKRRSIKSKRRSTKRRSRSRQRRTRKKT